MTGTKGRGAAADPAAESLAAALEAIPTSSDMVALQRIALADDRPEVQEAARLRIGDLVIAGNGGSDPVLDSALAQAEGRTVETREDIMSVGANAQMAADGTPTAIERGTVTHVGQRKVRLFKRTTVGWRPVDVVADNVEMLIGLGFRRRCGHCERADCQANLDMNGCIAREPRKFARCPVCPSRKRFWDPAPLEGFRHDTQIIEGEPDAMEVRFADYEQVTPDMRVKALLDDHMRAVHPSEARVQGLFRDAQARPVRRAETPQAVAQEEPA